MTLNGTALKTSAAGPLTEKRQLPVRFILQMILDNDRI